MVIYCDPLAGHIIQPVYLMIHRPVLTKNQTIAIGFQKWSALQ